MKTFKQIHTLLAGALLIAGTALWSGCSNNELLDSTTPETTINQQAGGISFKLKSPGTQTRASQDATTTESEVKTMYAAFFIKNEGEQESAYKLHRIYYSDSGNSSWGDGTKMAFTDTNGVKSYTVTEENMKTNSTYTGTYIVYFVANPESAIITKLKNYQDSGADARTTVGDFEKNLVAEGVAYDATATGSRGFTMVNKSTIEVGESPKTCEVALTRLAARFDFVNSSPTEATITSVKFNNLTKKSNLVQSSEKTPDTYFYGSTATELTKAWTKEGNTPTPGMTVYTYENLNTNASGNMLYSSIDVAYTLGTGGTSKTLRIELKEKDTPLALMRNHLYKINLNCIAGTYNVAVTDWTGGETVTVPNDKLAIVYTADSLGKVGDYVYNNNGALAFSDGGLRKMYLDGALEWTTSAHPAPVTNKGTCIGIMFSNQTSAEDKALGFSKGYVMALKDCGNKTSYAWGTTNTDTEIPNMTQLGKCIQDMNGLSYTTMLKKQYGNLDNYPAFKAADEYAVALPAKTSGWYLLSSGQFCTIAINLGGLSALKNDINSTSATSAKLYKYPFSNAQLEQLNGMMEQLGNANYGTIDFVGEYHTSTEINAMYMSYIFTGDNNLNPNYFSLVGGNYKNSQKRARPVFAF